MPVYPHPLSSDKTPPSAFEEAEEKLRALIHDLQSPRSLASEHAEVEATLQRDGREVLRLLMQGWCDRRVEAVPLCEITGADGLHRTHHREASREFESVFGSIEVTRDRVGVRGAEALVPADAALNLPDDRYTFGVRQRVAEEAVRGSYEEATDSIAATTGARLAKRQAEALVLSASVDFDAFYQTRSAPYGEQPLPSSTLLVLTVDGKGIVMLPSSLRPATRKAAEIAAQKLPKRKSKGEKSGRKRMATVAAVYDIEARARTPEDIVGELGRSPSTPRPKPTSKRVFASVQKTAHEVIGEVFAEAERRDPQHARRWIALVDGNLHQIVELEKAADAAGVAITLVLDIIHVTEYLWKAAWEFFKEGDIAAQKWVTHHLGNILRGRASAVAASLRRSATCAGLIKRANVDEAANYLLGHKKMMRYDLYLRDGLPIATGVIEGACRYLVKDRMDITGARWGLEGAEAVLRLRSIWASNDLDEYWRFHREQEFNRNHRSRYAANDEVWLERRTA